MIAGSDLNTPASMVAGMDLLAHHRSTPHPDSVVGVLGDGALLHELPLLAANRRIVREGGFSFVPDTETPEAWRVFPMLHLAHMMKRRAIPYRNTLDALQQLLDTCPGLEFDAASLSFLCEGNALNHECAHAQVLLQAEAAGVSFRGAEFVELLLTTEAFAIALEHAVACGVMQDGSTITKVLLSINGYANPFELATRFTNGPGRASRLERFAKQSPQSFMMLLAASAHLGNLRPTVREPSGDLVARLVEMVELSDDDIEESVLRDVVGIGLSIDQAFRTQTASTFFRFLRLEGHWVDLLKRPLEEAFAPEGLYARLIPRAVESVTHPCRTFNHAE